MPLPAYMVCSRSGSIDEASNQVSAFNIIESFKIFRKPVKRLDDLTHKQIASGLVRIVTVWIKEESDSADQVFEVSVIGRFPPMGQEVSFGNLQFSFTNQLQRVVLNDLLLAQFWGPGVLKFEARIRRVGEEQWLNAQTFPIILEEVALPFSATTENTSTLTSEVSLPNQ